MSFGKKETMYAVILTLLIGWSAYEYLFTPKYMEHKNNLQKIEELTKEIEKARRDARKLPDILARQEKIGKQFEETKKILVENLEIGGLYKLLQPIFNKVQLDMTKELKSITPVGREPQDFYIEDKWTISIDVPFEKFSYLLLEFYQYERLLDVTALPLTVRIDLKLNQPMVSVNLPVSTYAYKSEDQ